VIRPTPNPPDWSAHGRSSRPLSCGGSDRRGRGDGGSRVGGDGRAAGEAWFLGRPGAAGGADVLRRRLHRPHGQLARIRQLHRLLVSYMKTTNRRLPVDLFFWGFLLLANLGLCWLGFLLNLSVWRGADQFAQLSMAFASQLQQCEIIACLGAWAGQAPWMQQRSGLRCWGFRRGQQCEISDYSAGVSGAVGTSECY